MRKQVREIVKKWSPKNPFLKNVLTKSFPKMGTRRKRATRKEGRKGRKLDVFFQRRKHLVSLRRRNGRTLQIDREGEREREERERREGERRKRKSFFLTPFALKECSKLLRSSMESDPNRINL